MTRINLVPPADLHQKHLVAEYRELPRIYGLARAAYPRRAKLKIPPLYVLGTGHVTFFYDKLSFIIARHNALVDEMRRRGYVPQYLPPCPTTLPQEWLTHYLPTPEAIALSAARILERKPKS